jgi:arginyl-tRNA--protein-N-Asp/Glu arginylyltransferase
MKMSFNLYGTPPHKCSYLPNQLATTVFVDPKMPKNMKLYDELAQQGFRRSGNELYIPACKKCQACISVRVPVTEFVASRRQRRIWKKNQDLTILAATPVFKLEHFELYCRYLTARHQGDGMDKPTPKDYIDFLTSSWSKTIFYEIYLEEQLIGVAIVDRLQNALSAVYTFFDPDYHSRSLGVYAVLWEIEHCKQLEFKWLYLGYWIQDCQKMRYKNEYQPLEYYVNNSWQRQIFN